MYIILKHLKTDYITSTYSSVSQPFFPVTLSHQLHDAVQLHNYVSFKRFREMWEEKKTAVFLRKNLSDKQSSNKVTILIPNILGKIASTDKV